MADKKTAVGKHESSPKSFAPGWPVLLRGFIIFAIFALFAVLLYWFCLHHDKNVATWSGQDQPRDALIYQDKTFHLAAQLGESGLPASKYAMGKLLGEVKPTGKEALKSAVKVYAVLGSDKMIKEDYLMVIYEDGNKYIYYLDGINNPYVPNVESSE